MRICILILMVAGGAARAAELNGLLDPATISVAAQGAVRAQAGPAAGALVLQSAPLDPHLRIAACDQPLQAFVTGDGQLHNQTMVGVRCEGSVHWTLYNSVTVQSQAEVLVARRALERDTELTRADFQLETRRVPGALSAYVTEPDSLAGQRLRRPLAGGEPLAFDALAPAFLIHRGQQVVLLARAGGIEVRMAGVALADGRASDNIRVQNVSSQRIVEGIVRSDSVVEAPL
ncbi:MAG TPA: flagellar basal body P-ring formation chaperone FlgA [Steroidobacteraceae bacterium]|nr:flagellar basal body P-ring formation chaperone FlgA [Steroidobacteraceae bacterium]